MLGDEVVGDLLELFVWDLSLAWSDSLGLAGDSPTLGIDHRVAAALITDDVVRLRPASRRLRPDRLGTLLGHRCALGLHT